MRCACSEMALTRPPLPQISTPYHSAASVGLLLCRHMLLFS